MLGIRYTQPKLSAMMKEFESHWPAPHQSFFKELHIRTNSHEFVKNQKKPALTEVYNLCVRELLKFRRHHIMFTHKFIIQRLQRSQQEQILGTGGTHFPSYLASHVHETEAHIIPTDSNEN